MRIVQQKVIQTENNIKLNFLPPFEACLDRMKRVIQTYVDCEMPLEGVSIGLFKKTFLGQSDHHQGPSIP